MRAGWGVDDRIALHPFIVTERSPVALPITCLIVSMFRHTPTAPTDARRLVSGEEIDAHRHDDHQIIYAGSGVLAVTTGRGTWFAPGTQAIWVPAGTVHRHRAYGDLDLHLVGLPASDNRLGLDEPTVLAVSPLLRELIRAYTRGSGPVAGLEGDVDARRSRLREVLLDQLEAAPHQPAQLPAARDPRLMAVCALLEQNPADHRSLRELGAAAGVGERTLSRLFRSELALTFPQWRTQLRLYAALRLLAQGEPVTVVARRCGWSSTSAFIDVFRRAFGRTPGAQAHQAARYPTASASLSWQ